jgi:hypothetical protein
MFKGMKNKTDTADSSLSETMAARIEVNDVGDPAHQKKITDAVEALDRVIETKIEKGGCMSRTIRWRRLKRKSSRLSGPPGPQSRLRPQIRKVLIQIYQRRPRTR